MLTEDADGMETRDHHAPAFDACRGIVRPELPCLDSLSAMYCRLNVVHDPSRPLQGYIDGPLNDDASYLYRADAPI